MKYINIDINTDIDLIDLKCPVCKSGVKIYHNTKSGHVLYHSECTREICIFGMYGYKDKNILKNHIKQLMTKYEKI